MTNNKIPDWKRAVIAAMSVKYGDGAIGKRLDISKQTVKKYREMAEENNEVEMEGVNMKVSI